MSIKPLTPRQSDLIVANVLRATKDISALNNTGYRFISGCSGFIAHYDLYGFIAEYSQPGKLAKAIIDNVHANRYSNFTPGDQNYDYYHSKAAVYGRIAWQLAIA